MTRILRTLADHNISATHTIQYYDSRTIGKLDAHQFKFIFMKSVRLTLVQWLGRTRFAYYNSSNVR